MHKVIVSRWRDGVRPFQTRVHDECRKEAFEYCHLWQFQKLEHPDSFDSECASKDRLYECNQCVLRTLHCAVRTRAVLQATQAETTDGRIWNSKDLPILRLDHVPIESVLLGVREVFYTGGVFGHEKMNTARLLITRSRIKA
jgi:hypothetical protein